MAFGSVVESNSCANPISDLLRVYFRTRAARPRNRGGRAFRSIADKQISTRRRYRSLFLDKRSRAPRALYFLLLRSFLILFLAQEWLLLAGIFSNISLLSGSRVGTDPTRILSRVHPRSFFIFLVRHIFLRSTRQAGSGAAKGTMGSRIHQGGFVSLFAYCLAAEHRAEEPDRLSALNLAC